MSYKGKKKSNVVASEEGYNLYAELYNDSVGYLNSFEESILLKMFGDLQGLKVLDLGCGTGRLMRPLLNSGCADLTGVDVSEQMLKQAEKRFPQVKFVQSGVEEMPFEDDEFDLAVASFLIVHLPTLQEFFDEVYRVLKEGGVFIVTNINQRKAPKLKLKSGDEIVIESHYHRPEDVRAALEYSFFKIEKEEFVMDGKVWVNQILKVRK